MTQTPSSPGPTDKRLYALLTLLAEGDRDAILLERLLSDPGPLGSKHPALELLQSTPGTLRDDLAREVLLRVRRIVDAEAGKDGGSARDPRRFDHEAYRLIMGLARLVPHGLIAEAERDFPASIPSGAYDSMAYKQFLDELRFRHEMHQEFAR